ncbi:MAG: DNA alkylation repair protein [Burkholderiaceae bacterium]|nr:HEAT repeat domain-containing protein [Burkholderiales bacterium]MCZ8101872.1 DNA alkylation repair protein [Burkholderiales bacterium]MCZ8338819.1 DNA alkylation repair protein [Burkholderiaceae bacterium]
MAEPLKAQYGPEVPRSIAAMIERVHPTFATRAFVAQALAGYGELELLPRARHVARAMADHLPREYPVALDVVLRSLGPPAERTTGNGMAPFVYLPHVYWVADRGLEHLDDSVRAMHAITQRFTFEFGIRPFVERYPREMLAVLGRWCDDPSVHVRRLVSEGLRPRLPWAPRLKVFARDPRPVIALLERLRDDPDEYVRRSVANHLNDLGRDDPARLVELCTRWAEDAPPARRKLIRHALRTLVKRGDPHALTVLGYGERARVEVRGASIVPARAPIGGAVEIAFEVASTSRRVQRVLVDLRVAYAGARADADRTKVFKLDAGELGAGEVMTFRKRLSLRQMTTRTHHPGTHRVEALVNGAAFEVGTFEVTR